MRLARCVVTSNDVIAYIDPGKSELICEDSLFGRLLYFCNYSLSCLPSPGLSILVLSLAE